MYPVFLTFYFLLFTLISIYRFHYGIFLLFFLLPTYMIRFSIGPLPITLLEGMIWILIIIWVAKERSHITYHISHIIKKNKLLFLGSTLFILAATISIFTSVDIRTAAGEWKAFYIEPFLLFLILTYEFSKERKAPISNLQSAIIFSLVLCGLATSLLAIYQHFTGWMVPSAFWENRNTFRVTAWYGFPNGVGLFLAPIVPLSIYLLIQQVHIIRKRKWKLEIGNWKFFTNCVFFLFTVFPAILFAKSTGAIVGILAGLGILLLFYKKTRWPALILSVLGFGALLFTPQLEPIRTEVFMQDRSGQIRVAMWKEAVQLIKDRPVLGAGLASYDERIEPYHTTVNGEGIEIFHHPHNLFLTIWLNTGLLGLIGFIFILIWFFKIISNLQSPINRKNKVSDYLPIFLLATLITILMTSLVDSPYIKNDLSIFFWLLPAILISIDKKKKETLT